MKKNEAVLFSSVMMKIFVNERISDFGYDNGDEMKNMQILNDFI